MKRRKNTEASFHVQVAWWLSRNLPPEVVWTTFPAGGGGIRRGVLLKKQGLAPGWADLQFLTKDGFYGIELKVPGGRLSPEQRKTHVAITSLGWKMAVCHTMAEVLETLNGWGLWVDGGRV